MLAEKKRKMKRIWKILVPLFCLTSCVYAPIPSGQPLSGLVEQGSVEPIVFENEGSVCFRYFPTCYLETNPQHCSQVGFPNVVYTAETLEHADDHKMSLFIETSPPGLFSTSCTAVLQREGRLEIDQDHFSIQVHSLFVLEDTSIPGGACTADGGGAGRIEFDAVELLPGDYQLSLGEKSVEVSLDPSLVCVEFPVGGSPMTPSPLSTPNP